MEPQLTPRQRILNTLHRRKNDRVPWNGDLDYWMTYMRAEGRLLPRYDGAVNRLNLHRDLHVGFYLQGHFPFREHVEGCIVEHQLQGNERRAIYHTPIGDSEEVWRYSQSSCSEAPIEYLVKNDRRF